MKKLLLFLSLAFAAPVFTYAQGAPATPTVQGVQKWEYANLDQMATAGLYMLRLPNRTITEKDTATVAAKFLGQPVTKEAPLYAIILALGNQGWELVSITENGKDTSFWFKRPKAQ